MEIENNLYLREKVKMQKYKKLSGTHILLIHFLAHLCLFQLVKAQLVHIGSSGGTQTHTTTSAGPINIYYESLHTQFIYTQAEFLSAGITGGQDITQLGFYIVSPPNVPLNSYTIKLKNTNATTTTVYDGVGLTTVYTNSSYMPTPGGFDMLVLTIPFTYTGQNLLVDVCFAPISPWSSSGVVRTYNASNQMHYIRQDGVNTCPSNTTTSTTYKPQIQFLFTNPNPMVYDSLSVNHPTTLPVFIGTANAQILNFKVHTTGGLSPLNATQFVLNMTGTTNPTTDVLNAKLYYTGNSNLFSTAQQVGTTISSPSGTLAFSDNITLSPGQANFWLVYDISSSATPNNYIDAQLVSVTVDGIPRTPTNGNPAGKRQIVDPYANIPFFEGFENTWIDGAGFRDIPSVFWVNTPSSSDSSWRREDDGISAGWMSPSSGAYTPAGSNAAGGSSLHSARFHSYYVSNGNRGRLDLYLNFSPVGNKLLNFDYINTSGTDNLTIRLSTDGGVTFPTVVGTYNTTSGWQRFENISLGSSTSPTCVLRFEAKGDFGFSDIGLDNVRVRIPSPNDLQMVSMSSPTSGCGLGNETVTVLIKNIGSVMQTGFNVGFLLNGVPYIENVGSFFVNPGQTKAYTFTTLANLSVPGTYEIRPFTDLATDGDRTNDTLSSQFIESKPTVTTYPYVQDFEAGQGGWVSGGTNNSWAYGTPSKPTINTAASGTKCWVNGGLTGSSYNPSENSFVIGPCFNFSSLQNPVISLKINYVTENNWDGVVLQSSINNGASWQRVGNLGDPFNWYNNGNLTANPGGQSVGWAGNSGGWISAKNKLTNLAGQPSVLFRFAFASDASVNLEGFAFDDIVIQEGPILNLASPLVLCSGDTLTLDAGPNWNSYLWSTNENTRTIKVTTPGYYLVRVTDQYGFTAQDTIEVLGNILQLDLGANLFRCPGDTATFISNVSNPNVSFLWNTGDTTSSITVSQAGTYWLQITDQYGCVKRDTVELINFPTPNFILGNDTSFCAGGFIELNANANLSGASYLWNNGSTSPRLVVTAPGSYSVIVTSPNGCTATDTIHINLLYQPTVNLGPDVSLCQSTPLTLNAFNPNCSYLWSTGDTTSSITITQPGTYSVTVTGPGGCVARDTMQFSNFNPALVEITQPSVNCGSSTLSIANPQPGVSYLWSNGSTGPSAIITQNGQVIVQATTTDGCIAYDTANVIILPSVQANIGGIDTFYVNVPAQLVDASFPNPASWSWFINDGGTYTTQNPIHTFTNEGNYSITLIVSNGFCSDTAFKIVHVVKQPEVSKEEWKSLQNLVVYPNPNNGQFTVSAEFAYDNKVEIEIFNSLGQKIYYENVGNTQNLKSNLSIENLTNGIYHLKLSSEEGYAIVKLFVY